MSLGTLRTQHRRSPSAPQLAPTKPRRPHCCQKYHQTLEKGHLSKAGTEQRIVMLPTGTYGTNLGVGSPSPLETGTKTAVWTANRSGYTLAKLHVEWAACPHPAESARSYPRAHLFQPSEDKEHLSAAPKNEGATTSPINAFNSPHSISN